MKKLPCRNYVADGNKTRNNDCRCHTVTFSVINVKYARRSFPTVMKSLLEKRLIIVFAILLTVDTQPLIINPRFQLRACCMQMKLIKSQVNESSVERVHLFTSLILSRQKRRRGALDLYQTLLFRAFRQVFHNPDLLLISNL